MPSHLLARLLTPYHLRAIRVGVTTTFVVLAVMAWYAPLAPEAITMPALYWSVIALAVLGALGVAKAPWPAIFERGWGQWGLNAWSLADILLIAAAVVATGGAASQLVWLYALTTVFFGTYPRRAQAWLLGATLAGYFLAVRIEGSPIALGDLVLRSGILISVWFITSFLARELVTLVVENHHAREASERRTALLAVVAAAARTMDSRETEQVLRVVVQSTLDLGFVASGIAAAPGDDEPDGRFRLVHQAGALGDVTLPEGAGAFDGRRCSVLAAADGGIVLAVPVWVDGECDAILLGRTPDGDAPLRALEVEGLELLAAPVGRALESAKHARALEYQATHDALSGLPNRASFQATLDDCLRRYPDRCHVLFIDLDGFKRVNDLYGHAAGDRLLADAARRIAAALPDDARAARLGGDEFAVVLPDGGAPDRVERLAARVVDLLSAPFTLEGDEVRIGASVGVARADGAADATEIVRRADMAMYAAKRRGRGRAETYARSLGDSVVAEHEVDLDLSLAVAAGAIEVCCQPLIPGGAEELPPCGIEVLARWTHRRRGAIEPSVFIPLAEKNGSIVPLGAAVRKRAFAALEAWRRAGLVPDDFFVSVNVSPVELEAPGLAAKILAGLRLHDLEGRHLVVEITEDSLLRHSAEVMGTLSTLADHGVRIAIDDFGVGYSTFDYLRRMPVHVLKIDRRFVDGIELPRARALLGGVIDLAQRLGLETVAEGVETDTQASIARTLGSTFLQGYLFARPLGLDAFAERYLGADREAA